jgi:regulator of RNase E activity RraA
LGDTPIAGRAFPITVAAADEIPNEPYVGEIAAIETISPGEVLVYGGETTRPALFGELFAHAARFRGAVGAVVDGYIRDTRQLIELGFPVFSRGASPLDTRGRAEVVGWGESTVCGGVEVEPRDIVVADSDGVVIVPAALGAEVCEMISSRRRDERGAREDLRSGVGIQDVWDRWRVL